VGLGHRTRQALADPLLLGSVILFKHRRASLCPTEAYTKMLRDGRLSRAKGCAPRGQGAATAVARRCAQDRRTRRG